MWKRLLLPAVLVLFAGYYSLAFAADGIQQQDPRMAITRAGAVAMVINANANNAQRVQWYAAHMPPMPLFKDVDQREWYAPYVEVAFEQGIITGNTERLFRPSEPLREAEAIALVTRFKSAQSSVDDVFLTIPTTENNWLSRIISEAQTSGIKFRLPVQPDLVIQRQELFSLLESAGITAPETIVISMIPITTEFPSDVYAAPKILQPIIQNPVVVAGGAPVNTVTYAPTTPVYRPTAQTAQVVPQVQPTTATPYLSAKSFAITMPTLGVKDLTITHPSDFSHDGLLSPLKYGVGHLFSYPGQNGKILVYGHSSGYPWDVSKFTKIFRQINKLSIGDKIYVTYDGKLHTYQVTSKQTVDASDTSAYGQGGSEELILYTCWPPDSIKQRYLVHAVPVGTTVAQN
jgi:LPXTG-site transpeptidase (sortase) family protein